MIKAVLFDYNGTLYDDEEINRISWQKMFDKITGIKKDLHSHFSGCKALSDYQIIDYVTRKANKYLTKEEILCYVQEKEQLYREMVVASGNNNLRTGCEKLLNYLVNNNVLINMCSVSIKENIDFYFDFLKLDRWFDKNKIVYDDYKHINKKDMYMDAAKNINVSIEDCIVIEDSPRAIEHAINAGCKKIVAVKQSNTIMFKEVVQLINDFEELDYSIFE